MSRRLQSDGAPLAAAGARVEADDPITMIRIAITPAAFEAIAAPLPVKGAATGTVTFAERYDDPSHPTRVAVCGPNSDRSCAFCA